jgi:hypothetical protein
LALAFRRRFGRLAGQRIGRLTFNAERYLNRYVDYSRFLARRRGAADLFHVVDHSYSQLIHTLPARRCGVFCHDIDAFRCLREPRRESRPAGSAP